MRNGIMKMALEDLEPEVVAPQEEEARLDFVDAPEQDLADAEVAAGEVETADAEIGDADATAETLDTMADGLEETLPEGGMSEGEAKAIEIAVEHLYAAVGFPPKMRKLGPAMESFGKESPAETRIKATKLAIESMKERAQAIWKQIIEAVQRAIEFVQKFFKDLFNAAVKLEKRAEAVAAKAAAATGEHAAEHKVKVPALLSIGGHIPDGTGIANGFKQHMGLDILKQDRPGMLKAAADQINAMIEGDPAKAKEVMTGVLKGLTFGKPSANRSMGGEGDVVLEEPLVFGGKSAYLQISSGTKGKGSIGDSTGHKSVDGGEAAPVTAEQAASLAQAVAAHMKATYGHLETSVREAKAAANEVIKKVQESSKEEGSDAQALSGAVHSAVQLTCMMGVQLKKYDVAVSNAVLNFAAASIPKAAKSEKTAEVPAAA